MLENACRIQCLAEAAGDLAPEFPPEDVKTLYDKLSRGEQHVEVVLVGVGSQAEFLELLLVHVLLLLLVQYYTNLLYYL